jgi:hypothetical protein
MIRLGKNLPYALTAADTRYRDNLIATLEEEIIEDLLELELRRAKGPKQGQNIPVFSRLAWIYRDALLKIDKFKALGNYEIQRHQLSRDVSKNNDMAKRDFFANCSDLMDSPTRIIKSEFFERTKQFSHESLDQVAQFHQYIDTNGLWDLVHALFEPARKSAGRPPGRKYVGDSKLLLEMKALVKAGKSIPAAAKAVTASLKTGGTTASHAKRLEIAYQRRLKLRNSPVD